MSIQKITEQEIQELGVKSLPSRPSTPSLYSGSILSAEELKEAFDKLPEAIAKHFNDLLESTGLYDSAKPAETLAELIATNLSASHSLKNFFEDVKNGNLALYLAVDTEETPLADVLSELRHMIESKKSYTVTVDGEGDLLSDAALEGEHLTLTKGASTADILAEASAYADAPSGTVDADCTAPVSGSRIHRAIQSAKAACDARITNLENAGKDILYTYPEVSDVFSYTRLEENVLASTALLSMGAVPQTRLNFFPEPALSTYKSDTLSIAWDAEKSELVLNGTLLAAESPLRLAVYRGAARYEYMLLASFYRGGTVSTGDAMLSIVDQSGKSTSVSLTTDPLNTQEFSGMGVFSHITLSAARDTVFEDFRFNILLSREQYFSFEHFPFDSHFRFTLPKRLISCTRNLWTGGNLSGETYASFPLPPAPKNGIYAICVAPMSSIEGIHTCAVSVYAEDELLHTTRAVANEYCRFTVDPTKPITEVRVYAGQIPDTSVGHTVVLDRLHIEIRDYWDKPTSLTPYMKGRRDELIFPDSFSRFAHCFIGIDDKDHNGFDFSNHTFHESVKMLSLDGTLALEADASIAGRFSAPYETPDALLKNRYQPSAFFNAYDGDSYEECLWFDADRVYFQSELFEHLDVQGVKDFLNTCPIDVVYVVDKQSIFSMSEEEIDALGELPVFHSNPMGYLYFSENGTDAIDAYSKIQYQIKQKTEVTE